MHVSGGGGGAVVVRKTWITQQRRLFSAKTFDPFSQQEGSPVLPVPLPFLSRKKFRRVLLVNVFKKRRADPWREGGPVLHTFGKRLYFVYISYLRIYDKYAIKFKQASLTRVSVAGRCLLNAKIICCLVSCTGP